MEARYRAVGVGVVHADSSGGRAVIERIDASQRTALEVATAVRHDGFHGCWVLMIGTNDAANVAAGAGVGPAARITAMLDVIGDDPVLWVDARTARSAGAYADAAMREWNDALYLIAADRPNVEVLRWSEVVLPEWFSSDGIHYNATGRAARTELTAATLRERFPA